MKTSLLLQYNQPSASPPSKMMLAAYPSPAHQQQQATSPPAFGALSQRAHHGGLLSTATGFIPAAVPLALAPSAVFGHHHQQPVALRGPVAAPHILQHHFASVKVEEAKRRSESPRSRSPSSTPPAPQASKPQHTSFSIDAILGKKDEPKKQISSTSSSSSEALTTHHTSLLASPPSVGHTPHLTRTTANGLFYIYTAASPTPTGGHPTVVQAAQNPSPFSPFATSLRGHFDHHHHHHHELQRSPLGPLVLPPPGNYYYYYYYCYYLQ